MDIGDAILGIGKTVANVFTGGLAGTAIDIIESVTGTGLPPEKKAELKAKLEEEITKRERNAQRAASEAERNLTDRIAMLEGTASDLKQMPLVGRLVLFFRGAQRPMWGFAVMYMDLMVFSQQWPLQPASTTESAFWIINFLVLGFLFGERAVKNILPLVTQFLTQRKD